MASLDWLIDGFESIDRLVVALFDGSLIWFWFDGGLTVVALFFFFFLYLLWHVLEVERERDWCGSVVVSKIEVMDF